MVKLEAKKSNVLQFGTERVIGWDHPKRYFDTLVADLNRIPMDAVLYSCLLICY